MSEAAGAWCAAAVRGSPEWKKEAVHPEQIILAIEELKRSQTNGWGVQEGVNSRHNLSYLMLRLKRSGTVSRSTPRASRIHLLTFPRPTCRIHRSIEDNKVKVDHQ